MKWKIKIKIIGLQSCILCGLSLFCRLCEAQKSAGHYFIYSHWRLSLTLFPLLELMFDVLLSLWQMATTRSLLLVYFVCHYCFFLWQLCSECKSVILWVVYWIIKSNCSFSTSSSLSLPLFRLAGYVEALASRLGMQIPDLSPKQADMWQTRVSSHTVGTIVHHFKRTNLNPQPCHSSSIKQPKLISVFKLCMWKT